MKRQGKVSRITIRKKRLQRIQKKLKKKVLIQINLQTQEIQDLVVVQEADLAVVLQAAQMSLRRQKS